MRILENSVSIGLALMVVILEAFLQHLEDKTMQKAVAANLVPLTYKRYVCDNQARFETVYQFHSFLDILKKNKALKHTMEKKNQSQKLFLDATITNTAAGKFEFKIIQKNAIANVQKKHICLLIQYPEQSIYFLKNILIRN